jgi:hypothetical protein
MSKSTRARSSKPRAGFKARSKVGRKAAGHHHRRVHSKQGADTAASAERRGPPIPRRRHASGTSASRPQRATGMLSDQRHTILARGYQPRRLPDAKSLGRHGLSRVR